MITFNYFHHERANHLLITTHLPIGNFSAKITISGFTKCPKHCRASLSYDKATLLWSNKPLQHIVGSQNNHLINFQYLWLVSVMSVVPAVIGHVSRLECVTCLLQRWWMSWRLGSAGWPGFSPCVCSFKILILHMAFPHGLFVKVVWLLRWQLNTHKTTKRESRQGFLRFRPRISSDCLKYLHASTVSRGRNNKFCL